jgi:hypothetical protein
MIGHYVSLNTSAKIINDPFKNKPLNVGSNSIIAHQEQLVFNVTPKILRLWATRKNGKRDKCRTKLVQYCKDQKRIFMNPNFFIVGTPRQELLLYIIT